MAKRPAGVDPEEWRAQRNRIWRQRNMTFNVLMLVAIIAVLWRNCS